jgi:bifunctional DNA-binding transcriptional regulator/antitoxin component of YhaV-PrlF toxin-antitoxin module
MATTSVMAEARVRERNQITLPERVAQAGNIEAGDRFVVEVDPADPDTIRLHRIRDSYAGMLRDVYGDPAAALAEAREGWE